MKCSYSSNNVATQHVWHISSAFFQLRQPWHGKLSERLLVTWWLPQILSTFGLLERENAFHLFCLLFVHLPLCLLTPNYHHKTFPLAPLVCGSSIVLGSRASTSSFFISDSSLSINRGVITGHSKFINFH